MCIVLEFFRLIPQASLAKIRILLLLPIREV